MTKNGSIERAAKALAKSMSDSRHIIQGMLEELTPEACLIPSHYEEWKAIFSRALEIIDGKA